MAKQGFPLLFSCGKILLESVKKITVMHGISVMVNFCLKINKRYAWNKAVMVYHGPKIK